VIHMLHGRAGTSVAMHISRVTTVHERAHHVTDVPAWTIKLCQYLGLVQFQKLLFLGVVVFSFLFGKYCPIMKK